MPANCIINDDHYIIIYTGVVELAETINVYDNLTRSSKFDYARFGIIDCRDMTRAAYNPKEFHIHAAYSKAVVAILGQDEFRIGVVVSNEEAEAGVRKFIEATKKYESSWKRQIFWDYDEAFEWASQVPD